jgi:hypothetical protein
MEQRNLKIRNDMFQQKNKRAELREGGRERERRARCLFAPSYAYHSVPWSQMLYHCWKPSWNDVVLAFLNQKNFTDTTTLLPNPDTVQADRGSRKVWSYVEINLQEHAHAVGSSREAAAARNNPPRLLSFFLPPFFSSLINTYAAQHQDKKPAAQLLLHQHPSFCS